jgi:hypothetical protein
MEIRVETLEPTELAAWLGHGKGRPRPATAKLVQAGAERSGACGTCSRDTGVKLSSVTSEVKQVESTSSLGRARARGSWT